MFRTVFRSLAGMLLAAMLGQTAVAADDWSRLVGPEEVMAMQADGPVRLIDIRHRKLGYNRGHMVGATSMPLWSWRGPAGNSGRPPSDAELTNMVRAAGLRFDDRIVIVHSGLNEITFSAASWVYWVMKSSGFEHIAILDGGIKAWKAAGGSITNDVPRARPTATRVKFSDEWLATTEEVAAITSGNGTGTLVDARVETVHDTRSISGAVGYAMDLLLKPSKEEALTPLDTLEKLKYADIDWENQSVVTFCNNGLQGAATWFMASEVAGIQNVRLYAESLAGWTQHTQ